MWNHWNHNSHGKTSDLSRDKQETTNVKPTAAHKSDTMGSIATGDCEASDKTSSHKALHANSCVGLQSGDDPKLSENHKKVQMQTKPNFSVTKGGEYVTKSQTVKDGAEEVVKKIALAKNASLAPVIVPKGSLENKVYSLQKRSCERES